MNELGPTSPWQKHPLSTVAELISRGSAPCYVDRSRIHAIGQRCVTSSGFDHNYSRPHNEAITDGHLFARRGDVLLNSTGTGTLGRSCVFMGDGRFIVDGHVTVIRSKPDSLDGKYLNAVLQHPAGQLHIFNRCVTGSTNQIELSRSAIASSCISVPPLDEQRRIAAILDASEDTIRATEAVIEKLRLECMGLASEIAKRFLDVRPTTELASVASVERGKFTARPRNDPRFYGGKYPFIQTGDVAANRGRFISTASQSLNDRGLAVSKFFPAGTVAVTIAANIADTAILNRPMCFPDSVVGVVPNEDYESRFLEIVIRHHQHALNARAPQSAQKNINLTDLRPLPIPIIPKEEQRDVCGLIEAQIARQELEESGLIKLRLQHQGLLHDLLTGAVRTRP